MEQSPSWGAKSHSANQEIPHLLQNQKVLCHVHKKLPPVLILSQMNAVHTFANYFPKIYSNIVFPSMPRYSTWSLPFRFSDENFVRISQFSHACYILCPLHPPWLHHPNIYLVKCTSYEAPHYAAFSSLMTLPPSYVILLRIPFSNTFNLYSSLSARDLVWCSNETTGKIVVLHILNFNWRGESKMKDSE